MINFFRKIRQNLLLEGKTGKYLKYAIGEISLVVIGILIALQINNWNEDRKNVHREIKILTDLQSDIKYNIANINEGIILLEKGISQSQNILFAFDNQTKFDSTMIENFSFFTRYWDPDFRYASFENLKKEGVNLITNDSLRNKIIEIYEIDMDILDVSDLNKHNNYMTSVGDRIINKHFYKDRETGFQTFDYKKMMSDNEFFSFTSFFLRNQNVAWWRSKKFVEKAKLLNEDITKEIKQLL